MYISLNSASGLSGYRRGFGDANSDLRASNLQTVMGLLSPYMSSAAASALQNFLQSSVAGLSRIYTIVTAWRDGVGCPPYCVPDFAGLAKALSYNPAILETLQGSGSIALPDGTVLLGNANVISSQWFSSGMPNYDPSKLAQFPQCGPPQSVGAAPVCYQLADSGSAAAQAAMIAAATPPAAPPAAAISPATQYVPPVAVVPVTAPENVPAASAVSYPTFVPSPVAVKPVPITTPISSILAASTVAGPATPASAAISNGPTAGLALTPASASSPTGNATLDSAMNWISANPMLAAGIALGALFLFSSGGKR